MLGLMSAGAVKSDSVAWGIEWLRRAPRQASGPRGEDAHYTGTGFPRIFYLKYHGYAAFFPLWAMARYDWLMEDNGREVRWGI